MSAAEDKARSQIAAIEQIHGIKFLNREEIVCLITQKVVNESQILPVCTAINLWVAGNDIHGQAMIPLGIVEKTMDFERQRRRKKAIDGPGRT